MIFYLFRAFYSFPIYYICILDFIHIYIYMYKVKVLVAQLCVQLFVTPWTVACQAPLSMEFSRQEYWGG